MKLTSDELEPWRAGRWITGAEAVSQVRHAGVSDPEAQLSSWAGAHDGKAALLKVRAGVLIHDLGRGPEREKNAPVLTFYWLMPLVRSGWAANSLGWAGPDETLDAHDVEVNADDLKARLMNQLGGSEPALNIPPPPLAKRRGPRPRWDWSQAISALIEYADSEDLISAVVDGSLPQASLEQWMMDWFASRNHGEHPAESGIRSRVGGVVQQRLEANAAKACN